MNEIPTSEVAVQRTDEIELADDGSPLGTLKIGDKVFRPDPDKKDALIKVATLPSKKEIVQDLTGETDADESLLDLYEGYSDPVLRRRALELYVRDQKSVDEVAKDLNVPVQTVEMWAYNGKWNKAASHSVSVRAQEEARGLAALRIRVRRPIIESQLEGAKQIRERVLRDMESLSVKSAAEALKAAADVEARALGMSESGVITDGDAELDGGARKGADTKVPLVLVVNTGSASGILPVRKTGETVNVEVK